MHTVYILYSEKLNRFYTGYTQNLEERLDFHIEKNESRKFTSKAKDWVVFYKIACETKNQAESIEKHIKSMKSSKYVRNLKNYPEISEKLLEKYR